MPNLLPIARHVDDGCSRAAPRRPPGRRPRYVPAGGAWLASASPSTESVRRRGRTTHPARALSARPARQGRHGGRLRHQQLRRLHRACCDGAQREELLGAGRAGRRARGHHGRGPGRTRRHAAPGAAGLPRAARPAVRLLHPGHDHVGGRPAAENPNPTEDEIREGLAGNLCRCTGYQNIVRAVQAARRGHRRRRRDRRQVPHDRRRRPHDHRRPRSAGPACARRTQRLITGRTRWTENITLPGMLHLAILRSPYAHAPITAIDTAAGPASAGRDRRVQRRRHRRHQGVLACAWPVTEDMVTPAYPPLAVDEVRHVGEPVAVVVARDRASAVDALEAIEVDYEPLPVVLDLRGRAGRRVAAGARRRGHQQGVHLDLRLGRGRHRRRRRRDGRGRRRGSSSSGATCSSG